MPLDQIARRIAPIIGLGLCLGACAMLPARQHWAKVSPVTPAMSLNTGPKAPQAKADTYYQDAVAAIYRRDYGQALDLLQAARAKKADDARVLNAFGVVYDKLGRFDLSARYYAQAQAADPNSPIVSANVAYSASLQLRVAGEHALASATPSPSSQPAPQAEVVADAAPPPRANEGRVVVMGPGVVRLELPSAPPARALAVLTTGHPLLLVNASGRPGGAEPLRIQLANLGWSAPRDQVTSAPAQARTTIRYPGPDAAAALALARTLPLHAQLVACDDNCVNIQLVLGRDALAQGGRARGRGASDDQS
jgi:hypothetical protein